MTEKFPDFYARLREYQVRTWANKQMLPTEAAALEAVVMETWLNDEIQCESAHKFSGKESCSVDVTHLVTVRCKNRTFRVCTVSADTERWNIEHKAEHNCGNFYGDCISVRPI